MGQQGILLVNLGTPRSTSVRHVRHYLREFLSDPRVIDMAAWKRWLLLNCCILPFRPRRAAHAYQMIWGEKGSPLLEHGEALAEKLRAYFGARIPVALGMRYQSPSIQQALADLRAQQVEQVVVVPLFPQYSTAAWGSAVAKVYEVAAQDWNTLRVQVVPPFYAHPKFLDLWAAKLRPWLADANPDHVMISFHGLPERHILKSATAESACLASSQCCELATTANQFCYRAHCVATARGIALRTGLRPEQYSITFQSRLGRDPWIRPFTDEMVIARAKTGTKRLLMVSPSFVADCLETLEELAIRAKNDFLAHGGERFDLVPSLNSDDAWAETLVAILAEHGVP